jgi:plastocyanin
MRIATHGKILVASAAGLVLALVTTGLLMTHGRASAASASVATVSGSNRFTPNAVTVNVGDQVTFTYGGTSFHNATSATAAWPAITLSSGNTSGSTTAFTTPGTYYFYCSIHSDPANATEAHVTANDAMVGKIVVVAATTTTATATATTPAATATTPAATPTTKPPTVVATPSNAPCKLTVADATVAANTKELVVPFAQQARAGYVAIHEASASGGPGPVIGFTAQLAPGSQNTNLKVPLDRALKDGETVWAMLHTEDNGNTAYDGAAVDKPTVDASCGNSATGNIVTFQVKAKFAPAPPTVGNTEATRGSDTSFALVAMGVLAAFAVAGGSALVARRRPHRA